MPATVGIVIVFNLIMLVLLEAPLDQLRGRPRLDAECDRPGEGVGGRHWRRVATVFLTAMGAALVARGLVGVIG